MSKGRIVTVDEKGDDTVKQFISTGVDSNNYDVIVPVQNADEYGNLMNGKTRLLSATDIEPVVGIFGETITGTKKDDINVKFIYPQYNTDYDMQPAVVTGDGSVTVTDGALVVSSTTGTAKASSKSSVRYRSGHTGYGEFTASFNGTGTAEIGLLDPDRTNGWFIQVKNGVLYFGRRRGDTSDDFMVSQGNFNGDFDPSLLDLTKINIFEIVFGYLGVANAILRVKFDKWYILHVLKTEGRLTTTTVINPSFPLTSYTSGSMTVKSGSWCAGVVNGTGGSEQAYAGSRPFKSSGNTTLNSTDLATFGTFQNKTTYQTVNNKVKALLLKYHFFVDSPASGTGTVEVKIRKNATLTGTPSYTDVDSANSIMAFDSVQTYTSGGQLLLTEYIPYSSTVGTGTKSGGSADFNAETLGVYLLPGETATITAQNVSGNTNVVVRFIFDWAELF